MQSVCINICSNCKIILKRKVILKILRSVRHSTLKAETEPRYNLTESRTFYNCGTNWRISLPGSRSWDPPHVTLMQKRFGVLEVPVPLAKVGKQLGTLDAALATGTYTRAPAPLHVALPWRPRPRPVTRTKWWLNPPFSRENGNRLQAKIRPLLAFESRSCIVS